MTDAPPTSADPGRWIRFALVLLPAGTILLGFASFGIWQWKKDKAADRSFKYAQALRRSISQPGIQRHADILRIALGKSDWSLSIPAYLESTLGAENMGYTVRRTRFDDFSNVDAELTGKQRPREVVVALVFYKADAERLDVTIQAMAESLSVAHEVTGETVMRTLRFVFLPDTPEALSHLKNDLSHDSERLMHLWVLGGVDDDTIARIEQTLETKARGTRVIARPSCDSVTATETSARELKTLLLQAAETP